MNDILKVFLLNSRYLFNFVEERYLTKEDVINFMNINSKIKKEILSYYERSFKLEFPNLIKIKNKDFISLYVNFKLSKISKNVIDCIDLDLEFNVFEEIVFVSSNEIFTNEKFKLQPAIFYNCDSKRIHIRKTFVTNDEQSIFRNEIIKIHEEIFKSLILFKNSSFGEEYKLIYQKFGFYPFNQRKFLKLEKHQFLKSIKKHKRSVVYSLYEFQWQCFSNCGLRIISEYILNRSKSCENIRESLNEISEDFHSENGIETMIDSIESEYVVIC